MRINLIKII